MSALLLVALAGQTAQAAPPQEPTSPTVVVTGRRPNREKAVRHMTAVIAPLGDATQPLPRFSAPICPEAAGLPAAVALRFADRMRADARAAGLRVEPAGCAPNITVLFVPNGQAVVRTLRKKQPAMFGDMDPYRQRRLAADSGPVHVWSFTELRSADEDHLRTGTTTGLAAPELQVRSASILQSPTRIVVNGAVMLIDQPAAIGKTIDQLADYATMRLLAQARPVGSEASEPTILRLFDAGQDSPRELTVFDRAYLKALYHGLPTDLPVGKVAMMARAINRSLAATVTADDAASGTAP